MVNFYKTSPAGIAMFTAVNQASLAAVKTEAHICFLLLCFCTPVACFSLSLLLSSLPLNFHWSEAIPQLSSFVFFAFDCCFFSSVLPLLTFSFISTISSYMSKY